MSSHREAPEIAKDPVADGTDTYAFVSKENPDSVVLIANFIPLQQPNGGPNFYEFGDDVLYEIHVSNAGTSEADVTFQFRFRTEIRNPDTFLYNTGPISSISDETWNRPQFYSVTRKSGGKTRVLAEKVPCPPCNVGVRSTPDYAALASQARFQAELDKAGLGAITTEIREAPPFYYAEAYHQQYLAKNPGGYCGLGGTGICLPSTV